MLTSMGHFWLDSICLYISKTACDSTVTSFFSVKQRLTHTDDIRTYLSVSLYLTNRYLVDFANPWQAGLSVGSSCIGTHQHFFRNVPVLSFICNAEYVSTYSLIQP